MALTYKIKDFAIADNSVSVGFEITDDSDNQILFINKTVTKGSKTDNAIIEEAQAASQTEIDEWTGSKANVGKTWDPTSKTLS